MLKKNKIKISKRVKIPRTWKHTYRWYFPLEGSGAVLDMDENLIYFWYSEQLQGSFSVSYTFEEIVGHANEGFKKNGLRQFTYDDVFGCSLETINNISDDNERRNFTLTKLQQWIDSLNEKRYRILFYSTHRPLSFSPNNFKFVQVV